MVYGQMGIPGRSRGAGGEARSQATLMLAGYNLGMFVHLPAGGRSCL